MDRVRGRYLRYLRTAPNLNTNTGEAQVKIVLHAALARLGYGSTSTKCANSLRNPAKYLGYIVDARKGEFRMDLAQKVKAIIWIGKQTIASVKGNLEIPRLCANSLQTIVIQRWFFRSGGSPTCTHWTKSAQEREFHLSTEAGGSIRNPKVSSVYNSPSTSPV